MKPKSEDDIMKGFMTADAEDILDQSFKNKFMKGIKYVLDNYKLYGKETKSIVSNGVTRFENKKDIEYLLNNEQIVKFLDSDKLYILEKYILGKHQNEMKKYEKYILDDIKGLDYVQSEDNPDIMRGVKKGKNYFNYNKETHKLTWHLDNMSGFWTNEDHDAENPSHVGDTRMRQSEYDLGYKYIEYVLGGILGKYYNIEISDVSGSRNDGYSFVSK